jgi:hypothetical protein
MPNNSDSELLDKHLKYIYECCLAKLTTIQKFYSTDVNKSIVDVLQDIQFIAQEKKDNAFIVGSISALIDYFSYGEGDEQ